MEDLNIGIILAQIINFTILVFLFKHFLGSKIAAAIADRREKIKNIEFADSKADEKIHQAELEAAKIISEAKEKAEQMKKDSDTLAKKSKEKILQDAEMESNSLLNSARADIEKMKNTMFESVKTKIVDISLKLNKQLFDKEVASKDFMEKQLNSIKD